MAFTDYVDLRTAVIEEVGEPQLAEIFDRLTKLAEARFNRILRTGDQIATATLTFSGGTAPLPADFLAPIGLYDSYGQEYTFQTPQQTRPTGWQSYVSVQGGNLVTQGADGDRTLDYYAAIPTLTASMTTTNWLLQKYPSVYLYGVQLEAAKHLRRVDEAQALSALTDQALAEVSAQDFSERYSRARVRVAGVTP